MGTDRDILNKGFRFLALSLPLAFIGPGLIYNAFMNRHTAWHYLVLGVGAAICLTSVFFMFKGILTVVKSLGK